MSTVHAKSSFTEPDHTPEGPGYQPRTLVLLGAGDSHIQVLTTLATQRLVSTRVILIASHPRPMYSMMVPGFVAGHCTADDCVIPLEPLVRNAGVRWLQRSVKQLDCATQTLTLDDDSTLHYDWLSVNTGPVQNRDTLESAMPGARTHGLFVRPMEAFSALWPRVAEMGDARPLRIAVVAGGDAGIELALAVRHRLPTAALTLIAGNTPPWAQYDAKVQARILSALKTRHITVLQDTATGFDEGEVRLGCGARLTCDVPIVATSAQAPAWLLESGLALDAFGFLDVDTYQRSTSHPTVFAADGVSTRANYPLAHNLAAATAGKQLKPHHPPAHALNLLACGERYAIASWGRFSAQGRWVWWLKNWIDRRFMVRYSRSA